MSLVIYIYIYIFIYIYIYMERERRERERNIAVRRSYVGASADVTKGPMGRVLAGSLVMPWAEPWGGSHHLNEPHGLF